MLLLFLLVTWVGAMTLKGQDRPNILWLVSEDNGPYLGCYGDPLAQTPNLDRLAENGVRYTNAYATSPVCSAARSTLIHGAYGLKYGIHHHRSRHAVPADVKPYPIFFKEAGYYVTNNSKKDYNLIDDLDCWDESSRNAHYKNRNPGQPFFAIFNFTESHESRTFPGDVANKRESGIYPAKSRIDPSAIHLPDYHPDLPAIRQEWADYYDAVTNMDTQVGKRLDELEQARLTDNTIIVYYSDHGGAMARGKRSIKDSGTRVPLIVYFPERWKHLAPASPGASCDRFVSFVDFPATILSVIGAEIPDQMDGVPFLGQHDKAHRDHVFLYRGRMDARYDMVRAVKKGAFRYIVNYTCYRPNGQPYNYADRARTTPAWREAWRQGECNEAQSQYWELKPGEELYRTDLDPDEVDNVIAQSDYEDELEELRRICHEEIIRNRDVGFIPESLYAYFAGDSTVYQFAQSDAYHIERIKEVADRAIAGDPDNVRFLKKRLDDKDPLVRYWAAIGAVVLKEKSRPMHRPLYHLLSDEFAEVRIAAAEALAYLGWEHKAVKQIRKELEFKENKDQHIYTYAANVLVYLDKDQVMKLKPLLESIAKDKRYGNATRVAEGLLANKIPSE